jgi:hypothetical protein
LESPFRPAADSPSSTLLAETIEGLTQAYWALMTAIRW